MFELLELIPKHDWENAIKGLRKGMFPSYDSIRPAEKFYIKALMSKHPQDRPEITQILSFVEKQISEIVLCEGNFHFKCYNIEYFPNFIMLRFCLINKNNLFC